MKSSEIGAAFLGVAIALAVMLATGEVALRIYTSRAIYYDVEMTRYSNELKLVSSNARIGHVHRPGGSSILMGVRVAINSDGLRDREYPIERGDARRMVFLGDSLTFGWGVASEDTFESLLEAKLDQLHPTEVLNFGTGNYNTEQSVNLFIDKGLKYDVDEVVLFFFINDAEPTPLRSRWAFLGHSRLATFVWSRVKGVRSQTAATRSFEEYYSNLYEEDQPGWIRAREAFRSLKQTCDERGIGLKVVLLPELHDPAREPFREQHQKLMRFLAEQGIASLDLAPLFRSETEPLSLWVALDDAHPNAKAHRRIAELVLPFIAEPES